MFKLPTRDQDPSLNFILQHSSSVPLSSGNLRSKRVRKCPPGSALGSSKTLQTHLQKRKIKVLKYNFSQVSHKNGFVTWVAPVPNSGNRVGQSPQQLCLKMISPEISNSGELCNQLKSMRQEAAILKLAGTDLTIGIRRIRRLYLKNLTRDGYFLTSAGVLSETPQVNILDFLQVARKMSIKKKLLLIRKLVDIVKTLHQRGVAHLNLTPESIFVDQEGNLKLADFGLAQSLQSYQPQLLLGNSSYVPPEHLNAGEVINPKGQDEWAVAVMAFSLLFYRLPWRLASPSNHLYSMYCSNNFEFWKRSYWGDISVPDFSYLRVVFNSALSPVSSRRVNLFRTKDFGKPLAAEEDAALRAFVKKVVARIQTNNYIKGY